MAWVKYIGKTVREEDAFGAQGGQHLVVQPGDVIQVPQDIATKLTTNESTLWQATSDPTQAGRHTVASATATPTIAAAAGAGTTPPTPTASGDDNAGTISWGTGTTPAAGAQATVTFAIPFPASGRKPNVVLCPANAATAALQPYPTTVGYTSFQVALGTAPAASQGAATYSISYHIVG